ncbi:Gfo/Idh/MocA family oxidoreductase [Streptomyces althioticus]|uniref:Gfo/Idh/MocA family oxidoreductase n=1 Tax=Streptomyces althioticus TaxID=83380 RepID=UPI003812B1F2
MTSSSGRPRAAVVGTGASVVGGHLPALRAHADRVELVAAVDVDPGRLDVFRAEAGEGVAGFSSTEAMLDAVRPDLVLIGTPPSLHREQTVAALTAGAWVLCEKPLCLSLAEYDEIAAAEAVSGAYASVIFQHRYGSGAVRARELIRGGELGAPLVAHCQTTWHRDAGYYSVPWRGRWATEGGGPTMGHGIHQYDLLLHLLGEWEEVQAMAARLVHDTESEDVSTALVRFANGALATVVNSVLSPDEVSRVRVDCADATVELTHLYGHVNDDWVYTPAPHVAEERVAAWRGAGAGVRGARGARGVPGGQGVPDAPGGQSGQGGRGGLDVPSSHTAQLGFVLDAWDAGVRPPGSGREARNTLEFAAALYKAAFTGRPVRAGEIGPGDPFHEAMHGGFGTTWSGVGRA